MLVHGALVNANLWRKVVPLLHGRTRVTLDLPLGSHIEAMPRDADLTPPALADLIADALAALELEDVTIVGNDTGGGLTRSSPRAIPPARQRRPNVVRRLRQLPAAALPLGARARPHPGAIPVAYGGLRARRLRRLPIAYGWLSNEALEPEEDSYVLPVLTNGGVRRDLRKLLAASTRGTPSTPRRS